MKCIIPNQKVRRANTSEKLIPVLDEGRRLTHLRQGIRLKLTEDSMSPAVCGLFRPVILLPQSLVERLSPGQLRAVLLHEVIHLRRGDVWVNCAQALLQIVYWWHPLFWLANARIRRVREEAVDDAVMLALRDDAEIYAPTLLEVAKLAFNRPMVSLGLVGILESRSALRQRIERLVNFNVPKKAGLTVASILGILAFSAIALPMGQAPEKTNAPAPGLQPDNNSSSATNVVESKMEANALVQDGKRFYEMGKFEEAETNFNQALKLDPDNQRAFYYLSLVTQAKWSPKVGVGLPVPNQYATNRLGVLTPPHALFAGMPVPNPDATNTGVHTSPGREAIYRKLNNIRLESVPWGDGISFTNALRFLAEQSRLLDPDKTGINFIFNPNVEPSNNSAPAPVKINPVTGQLEATHMNASPVVVDASIINVKLTMKDVSLHDLLDAVTKAADHPIKYSVEDYAVVISPKPIGPEPPALEMRVFNVNTNVFRRNLWQETKLPQNSSTLTMVTNYFALKGPDLTAPGRSIAYGDKLGLLFVKATPSEMDTIERIIQALNQVPPQIHIKARFIEVEQNNNAALGFDWYLGSFSNSPVVANSRSAPSLAVPSSAANPPGSFPTSTAASNPLLTGILSSSNAKITLHALESRPRTKTLAEPECVTTSGRQTQMRATDIDEILTNFTIHTTSSNSPSFVPQIGKMEIGPVVDVVPYVLSDGYTINLTVTASVTEFLGYAKPTNSLIAYINGLKVTVPAPLPKFYTQKLSAHVNLWDGQTQVLIGSPTPAIQFNRSKVPLLGDLPLVGGLFRGQTETSVKKNLIVFLTVTIVDPAGNRVHTEDELRQIQEKTKSYAPPQPNISSPSP